MAASGTLIQIHLEGSKSSVFVHGECAGGEFRVFEHGKSSPCASANAAVARVRKDFAKQTNAYLYISFKVDNRFILADELRSDPEVGIPNAEALALRLAKSLAKKRHKGGTAHEIELEAETLLEERPDVLEFARATLLS